MEAIEDVCLLNMTARRCNRTVLHTAHFQPLIGLKVLNEQSKVLLYISVMNGLLL